MKTQIMMSPTGHLFIIEPFGFYYIFEGLPQLGYWKNQKKMIKFYQEAFGFELIGRM